MENQGRRSILCPNCGRLISRDESACPHCGLRNPGARWRNNFLIRGFTQGPQLLRNITYVCSAMFILSILISPTSTGFAMNPLSFLSPGNKSLFLLGATGTIPIDRFHRWWTVITANYLHGSILHLLFNMIALRQIGPLILQEFGASRTFCIFTLSGIGGFAASYFAGIPLTLGASGSVCGLIGAALFYGKSRGGQFGQYVYQQVGGWAISIFIFGFLVPGINNWAHGGGLVCGVLLALVLGYHERASENFSHKFLAGACVLATVGTLLWAVGTSLLILSF
ncbi:MAG: rhomboid family intramembrane serine protease [Syntrophobacteraceae bacterium]